MNTFPIKKININVRSGMNMLAKGSDYSQGVILILFLI